MPKTKKYEGLFSIPAQDGNFTSAIGQLSVAELEEFQTELIAHEIDEHCHKGRINAVAKEIRNRKGSSTEITAVEKMAEDIQTAEELYGDGMPYEIDRIENQIRFYQDQAGAALLEMGKCFIRIKAHEEHRRFLAAIENVKMTTRSVQYAMLAARKFSNTKSISYLGGTKMLALSVLDEEQIETLDKGGDVNGLTLDDIDRMSTRELRENLRKEREKIKKEKDARKKDREAQEAAIAQKEIKINELDQQLRYQQPPTKEQTARAGLYALNKDYTFALADVNASVRKAYAVVREAEKIPGADVQMLSEWFGQFSVEMETFAALHQTWTDEIDNAFPIEEGKIKEAQDV